MRPAMRTGRAALALLIVVLAVRAFPEPAKLATIDEIAAAGASSSLDYAKAKNAAAIAAAAVPDLIKLKSATVSAEYGYKGSSSGSSTGASDGITLAASVPIVDQIALSASVSPESSSSVSASLSPLAHSDSRAQALIAYAKALASADEAGRTAGSKAVKAALAWMSLKRQLDTVEKTAALKEESYAAAKAANAIDAESTTLDDLVSAMKDWSDARSSLVKAQAAELAVETSLHSALGASSGEVEVSVLDAQALASALDSLESSLSDALTSGPAESYSLKAAALDVESSAAKAKAIWAFEPELSLSAGVGIPASGGSPSPQASVKLTLSLDDLRGVQKANAEDSLAVARKALALQKSADRSSYEVAVAAVKKARINREGAKIARDLSSELADVAAYSFKSGSYSAIENEGAALSLASAEDGYYQALVDEYSAWLDLAALAGKSATGA
jgi:hypothetical protein